MRFLASNFQALFVLSLVLDIQALPQTSAFQALKRDENGYKAKSNCDPWRSKEDSKRLWDDSLAGVIGDDYINKHGVANWIGNLHKDIFNEPTSSWSCWDLGIDCEVHRPCPDYAHKNMEGAYYLARSVENAVGALRSARDYMQESTFNQTLNVPQITSDFRRQESDAEPNVLVLIAATFGMLAGSTAPIAPASGAFGVASGMFAFAGNAEPPKVDKSEDFEGKLYKMVQDIFTMFSDRIDDTIGALVGEEGKDQKLIPREMTKQSFDNAVINALGDGQWLNDDPAAGMKESMEAAYNKIKQSLVWTVIRHGRKGFWFIDSDVDKGKCGDGGDDHPEEFWHNGANGCVKLMEVKKKTRLETDLAYMPQDIHDKIWGNDGDYDLDVKKTFENSLECWKKNDGKVAEVNLDSVKDSDLPMCWFGIPLVRGAKHDKPRDLVDKLNYIEMDEFEGHEKGTRWFGEFEDDGSLVIKG